MNVGNFNERLNYSYPYSSSTDDYGQVTQSFVTGSCWAALKYESGGEADSNGVYNTQARYKFTIRRNDNITEQAKLTFKNRDYNITFIELTVDEKNRFQIISAERRI